MHIPHKAVHLLKSPRAKLQARHPFLQWLHLLTGLPVPNLYQLQVAHSPIGQPVPGMGWRWRKDGFPCLGLWGFRSEGD